MTINVGGFRDNPGLMTGRRLLLYSSTKYTMIRRHSFQVQASNTVPFIKVLLGLLMRDIP